MDRAKVNLKPNPTLNRTLDRTLNRAWSFCPLVSSCHSLLLCSCLPIVLLSSFPPVLLLLSSCPLDLSSSSFFFLLPFLSSSPFILLSSCPLIAPLALLLSSVGNKYLAVSLKVASPFSNLLYPIIPTPSFTPDPYPNPPKKDQFRNKTDRIVAVRTSTRRVGARVEVWG